LSAIGQFENPREVMLVTQKPFKCKATGCPYTYVKRSSR